MAEATPTEKADAAPKRTATVMRWGLIALVVIAVGLGAGYALGRNSGEDLDAARAEGATAGLTHGKELGGDPYSQGEAAGRRITFPPAYRDSYRKAYLDSYEGTDFKAPDSDQISVAVP